MHCFLIFNSCIKRVAPLLDRQYIPLLEAPKPTPLIPCYSMQYTGNAIKQLLYYQESVGTLLRDAGNHA